MTDGSLVNGLNITNITSTTVGPAIYLDAATKDWAIMGTNTGAASGTDKFVIRDFTSATDRFVIDGPTGFTGMGTTVPQSILHVTSTSSSVSAILQLGNGNQPTRDWLFDVDGSANMSLRNEGNGTLLSVMSFNATNGNVGIGSAATATTAKLDIAGNIKIADGTQGLGKVLTSDAAGLATWQNGPAKIAFNAGNNPVSNQAINSTSTTVQFGAGISYFNDGGGYSTTNNQFTPPSSGVYQLSTNVVITGASTGSIIQLLLRDGGGKLAECDITITTNGSGYTSASLNVTISTAVRSGPFWVTISSTGGGGSIDAYSSTFSGHKIY